VVSQVVTGRILSNRSRKSIATKIVQQMNCKVGGASWTTSNPSALKDLMAVGFDLSKDSINKNVAFGALVASMDDNFTQYFSQVSPFLIIIFLNLYFSRSIFFYYL